MASTLNEESVERKLHAVNNTQDGIQSMSLWIIHHKAHHKKIVDLWLKVLKKGKTAHRLTLFYLCNDVVQNCKKKQAKIYMETFKGILKDAAPFVRDPAIKTNVGRIFTIWEERNVYDSNFISELKEVLEPDTANRHSTRASQVAASPKPKPKPPKPAPQQPPKPAPQQPPKPAPQQQTAQQTSEADEKAKLNHQQIVADFKAQKMLEKISGVSIIESEGELKNMQLSTLRLDASNLEAVKQLKEKPSRILQFVAKNFSVGDAKDFKSDRAHGKEFSRQFEDACNKLDDYVLHLQKEIDHRTTMITMLEQSELFYEDQYKEAKIVANAYKNFGSRVAIVKKKLDELKLTLPDPPSPIPSPTPDAPSPGSTPPADIEMQADNTEAVDMELSESDNETDATCNILEVANDAVPTSTPPPTLPPPPPPSNPSSCANPVGVSATTNTTKCIVQPISSVTQITMKHKEANAEISPQSITWPPSPSSDSNQMADHKGLTEENYDPGAVDSKKAEECNSLEKRIASMLPNLPLGASISSPINEVPPPTLQQQPSSRKEHRYHSERKHSRSSTTASDESPDWLDGSSGRSSSTSPAHSSHKSSHRKVHSSSSGMHNSSSSSSSSSSRVASSAAAVTTTTAAAATTAYDSPPLSNDEGSSTPLNDEGGGTPVQDEKEEQTTRENPIDFLTKLINQTQKSPKTSTASFLQNLMNTGMKQFTSYDEKTKETPVDLNAPPPMPPQMPPPPLGPVPVSMPNQSPMQPPSPQHNQTTPPQSWAAWKAQHGPPDDIPNMITSAPPPPPPNMPPQILSPQQHERVGMTSIPPRPDLTTLPPLMGPPPPPDHLPGMAPMPPLPDSLPSGVAPVPPPDCLPPGMVNPGTEGIPPPGMPPMQPPESVGMSNIQRHEQMVMSGGIPGINPPFHPPDTSLPPRSPWKLDMNAPYCPISNASDPSDGYNSSPQGQTSPEPCPMPMPPPWMSQPPPQHDTSIPPPMTMGPPPPHVRSMARSVLQDYNPSDNISPLSDSLQGVKPPPQAPSPSNGNTPPIYTSRVNRLLSQSEFLDDQREFTEKLKRKTTSNLVTPLIVDSLPELSETVGTVRNLTAIKLEEDASGESNPAANADEGESNPLADGGTAEDTEAENKEEEPIGAPILTVSGIASRRYEPERLRTITDHRGDSSRRTDSMVRRFEQPVTDPTTHRQTADSYRDRRRTDREFYRSAAYPREAFSYTYNQDWQRYYAQTNPYMGPPTKRPYEPYNIYYPSKY